MVYVPSKVTNHRPVWHRFYQLQLHLLRTLCITVAVLCGTVGPCSVKPTREPRWRNELAQCSTVVKLEKLGECGFSSWVYKIASVKSIRILMKNIDEINLPLPFVKLFDMTGGVSVRGAVDLILMRKNFNCFN